ncbi:aspartyl/asparaginyl beta-hydroxylase domain-containing protein [Azospirillum sp. B4]|uniref:aspartyl/asparaginyl beta-hydroxylase domain-containing protein n=1 Tax=Azospirillum sp. B4 TaxID=95605 RepID=UPI0005C928F8|nr:aspartyl/asparaginyl beta-hydroxylase domain-containing protein [Azospirillum sp. B4]
MHPWQERTRGSGLTLHGALDMAIDPLPLQRDFAVLDRDLPQGARKHFGATDGWTAVSLLDRALDAPARATPALALMPSVAALLARADWDVRGCYLLRQAPGSVLRWHFDHQALHLEEARLLIPIIVPAAATTWIGHEAVAYPPGRGWTGDFALPHQVDNPSDGQRIVLGIDVVTTPSLVRRFPAALMADVPQRCALAGECSNLLLAWRAGQGL